MLGLEEFDKVPHENGSHSGQSRIIRKACFEHPDYIPLLEKAYANWHQPEQSTGEQVYFRTGLMYCGPANHKVMLAVKEAARTNAIALHNADGHPSLAAFRITDNMQALMEQDAGFLLPEKCISLFIEEAKQKGALIQTGEKIHEWHIKNGIVKVQTHKGVYSASRLVITSGAWAGKLIKNLTIPLKVTRQIILWTEPANPSFFMPENFPCWLIVDHDIKGAWYGFPYLSGTKFPGPAGLKFAYHFPGDETDADHVNRKVSANEIQTLVSEALRYFLPPPHEKITTIKTCLYTYSPDENFIIDRLPGYEDNVIVACGFSGHGFKFASVVGEILADLALEGKTNLPIEFLNFSRFNTEIG